MNFHRRSLRLANYDYSKAGMYYVTICINQHLCLFGKIVDQKLQLNDAGKMIAKSFIEITKYYCGFNVDSFIVMPDHFHGIIIINVQNVGAPPRGRPIRMTMMIVTNFFQISFTLSSICTGAPILNISNTSCI